MRVRGLQGLLESGGALQALPHAYARGGTEHAVDLATEAILSTHVTPADRGDTQTGPESLVLAQAGLIAAGSPAAVVELVADKGYHDHRLLAQCTELGVRTYIPERQQQSRCWTDEPAEYEIAFRGNRRRVRGRMGKTSQPLAQ